MKQVTGTGRKRQLRKESVTPGANTNTKTKTNKRIPSPKTNARKDINISERTSANKFFKNANSNKFTETKKIAF